MLRPSVSLRASLASLLLAAPIVAIPGSARAAGYQVRPGDPDWAANAFAGMAAKGYDASTAWSNPAAMVRLSGNAIDLGINGVFPSARFSGQNVIGGVPTSGSTGGNATPPAALPSGAAVWSVTPALKLGLALQAPFGLKTDYPVDFVGRYQALQTSIRDIEIGLAIAYRVSPHFAIGAGPIIDHRSARLTRAINTGPTAALTGDPVGDINGSDWGIGYHLGALYTFNTHLRVGVDYRSRISEELDGVQTISIPPLITALNPAAAAMLAAGNSAGETRMTLPDVLTVSAVWDISPQWSALATVQWTGWGVLKTQVITQTNGMTQSLVANMHDSWMASVGANYRPRWAPRLMLQGGVGYDTGASTDATRTPQIPGLAEVILGVGAAYRVSPQVVMRVSYLHEAGVGGDGVRYSGGPTAGTLVGSYATDVDVVGIGTSVSF